MIGRTNAVKTFLWGVLGVLAAVTFGRFNGGLGVTTDLSDAAPWGLWIAFDVMAGVALAAGGFVLAATVYIFRLEKYRPFVRPAILTAFLGYAAVAVGLMYDLGLPWRIWHPVAFPQHHSVLFEVAMCVMLYLTVLSLEFLPVVLEHRFFDRPLFRMLRNVLKKVAIPLVIAGIVLSTLHQSSLGSLFLITPYRVDPLWYSPIIWVLFFVSAIALGLMMVTLESFVSAWLFGHRLRMERLSGLGRAASIVLFTYVALRLGDLGARGALGGVLDGSPMASLFLFEIAFSALIPAVLLSLPRIRKSPAGLGIASVMTVFGIIGYRFDVCLVAFQRPEGMSYFPTWMEFAVSIGIVAGALLIFILFVEKLRVYEEEHEVDQTAAPGAAFDPSSLRVLMPERLSAPRRFTFAFTICAAITLALLPAGAITKARPEATPVSRVRALDGFVLDHSEDAGHEFALLEDRSTPPDDARALKLLLLDGNRDGRYVLFHHDAHVEALRATDSCETCHHQDRPFERQSACGACHRDMYAETDIFEHATHVAWLGGNDGCSRCHTDPGAVKTRVTSTPCIECHQQMAAAGSIVLPPEGGAKGIAASYVDAMHGLCVRCHEQKRTEESARFGEGFARCLNCHRNATGAPVERVAPYVVTGRAADERQIAKGDG